MKNLLALILLIVASGCFVEETKIEPPKLPAPDQPRRRCPGPRCPKELGKCPVHDEKGNLRSSGEIS